MCSSHCPERWASYRNYSPDISQRIGVPDRTPCFWGLSGQIDTDQSATFKIIFQLHELSTGGSHSFADCGGHSCILRSQHAVRHEVSDELMNLVDLGSTCGFPEMGDLHLWMVYKWKIHENSINKWMIWGYPYDSGNQIEAPHRYCSQRWVALPPGARFKHLMFIPVCNGLPMMMSDFCISFVPRSRNFRQENGFIGKHMGCKLI